jgi:hypothetical protein
MIKNVLEHIGGVGIYGVLSICIFFAFFTGVLLWAGRMKKSHLTSMSTLPLEDGNKSQNITKN